LNVQLSRDAASGGVCARFSDTGPGFTPRALAALFSPFAAPRPGHLGLGLGLARRILRRFGGDCGNHCKNQRPCRRSEKSIESLGRHGWDSSVGRTRCRLQGRTRRFGAVMNRRFCYLRSICRIAEDQQAV